MSYDALLPPHMAQFRLDVRLIGRRLSRFCGSRMALPALKVFMIAVVVVYETLLIAGLMQVGLALPMAWYFHRATVMGLPANLLVSPLTGILMPAAVAALALSYVWMPLARLPASVAGLALEGITGTVRWVGTLHVADLRVATPSTLAAIAAAVAVGVAMLLVRRRSGFACGGLLGLLGSALWIALVPPAPIAGPICWNSPPLMSGKPIPPCWSRPKAARSWWSAGRHAFRIRYRRRCSLAIFLVATHLAPRRRSGHACAL